MKTCPQCGCYMPDKWITCPACDYNLASKVFSNSVYQVKIHYKDGTIANNIFGIRENAINNAKKTMDQFGYCIEKIEIFDCKKIGIFYPNT